MQKPDLNHAVVVLSGGQDSTTCLFWALHHFDKVSAITFDYGQRHAVEIEAAQRVFTLAADTSPKVGKHWLVKVGRILESTSPLVSDNELEQYADPQSLPDGLEKTFVPMRNQFFLTLAMNHAIAMGAATLVTGVCQEDYGGYPDCRQAFIDSLRITSALGLGLDAHELRIETPLMNLSKAESIWLADSLDALGVLAWSHTSYDGQYPPTGKDHATLLREKGFTEARMPDPLILRAVDEGLMKMPDRVGYDSQAVASITEEIHRTRAILDAA